MRLSLRTLLAFEDNVFDVEQHRRLEQLLPTDPNAETTLGRIRSVVRNPKLGVPGLVDHQEELDPNYVAEYLDHQMPANVQDQFESYCLSADKFLAEIASVHHILANVLGEPARTSRECRIKCYNVLPSGNAPQYGTESASGTYPPFTPPKHFRPLVSQEPTSTKPAEKRPLLSLWNLFSSKKAIKDTPEQTAPSTQNNSAQNNSAQNNSLWSFTKIGLLVAALLFGWQQIEKQRVAHSLQNITEPAAVTENVAVPEVTLDNTSGEHFVEIVTLNETEIADSVKAHTVETHAEPPEIIEPMTIAAPKANESLPPKPVKQETSLPKPVEQTSFIKESATSDLLSASVLPAEDPFAAAPLPPAELVGTDPFQTESIPATSIPTEEPTSVTDETSANAIEADIIESDVSETVTIESEKSTSETSAAVKPALEETKIMEPTETIIVFQPIAAKQQADQVLAKGPTERPVRSVTRSPLPENVWQAKEPSEMTTVASSVAQPPATRVPQILQPINIASPHTQPVMQTSGTIAAQRILGQALPSQEGYPNVMFSAVTSNSPWQLIPLPFDLNGNQYLLTATPFRGSFELASSYRIEMIGDTKLCILPIDVTGTPGIYVDYGRIIIKALQPNRSLRIETEKSSGMVSTTGTESVMFIDTFAELTHPANVTKSAEGQQPKTGPILGFVPKHGEQIVWKSIAQPQPFLVNSQGSLLLQSDQYRFGEIRALPNWLGTLPMSQEDRFLADVCRKNFLEYGGNGEQALVKLIQDESPAVRILGLRLWGDLGNFDVPLTVMAERRKENEAVRQVLVLYFQEVMLRDAETVQRFADAIQIVKEAKKN